MCFQVNCPGQLAQEVLIVRRAALIRQNRHLIVLALRNIDQRDLVRFTTRLVVETLQLAQQLRRLPQQMEGLPLLPAEQTHLVHKGLAQVEIGVDLVHWTVEPFRLNLRLSNGGLTQKWVVAKCSKENNYDLDVIESHNLNDCDLTMHLKTGMIFFSVLYFFFGSDISFSVLIFFFSTHISTLKIFP